MEYLIYSYTRVYNTYNASLFHHIHTYTPTHAHHRQCKTHDIFSDKPIRFGIIRVYMHSFKVQAQPRMTRVHFIRPPYITRDDTLYTKAENTIPFGPHIMVQILYIIKAQSSRSHTEKKGIISILSFEREITSDIRLHTHTHTPISRLFHLLLVFFLSIYIGLLSARRF